MKDYASAVLISLLVASLLILAIVSYASAEKYLIIHPIENTDGTPIEDLAGVIVKCGDAEWKDIGMTTVWESETEDSCIMKAYNTSGNQSDPWEIKLGVKPYPPMYLIYEQ